MTNERVLILDGSRSLFNTGSSPPEERTDTQLGLQPIPRFREIVLDVVKSLISSSSGAASPGKIAPLDVGVMCETHVVRTLTGRIYAAVIEAVKS